MNNLAMSEGTISKVTKEELYDEVIGFLKYILRDGNENANIWEWTGKSDRIDRHDLIRLGVAIHRLAYHIRFTVDLENKRWKENGGEEVTNCVYS